MSIPSHDIGAVPPRVSGVESGGAGGGAPPIINNQTGSEISFFVNENRSQNVDVTLYIQEAPLKTVVAEGGTLALSSFHSGDGISHLTTLSGSIAWTNRPAELFRTDDAVLTVLPFEAEFRLNWKGVVAGGDGAPLAEGNYTLCLKVSDGNGNVSDCDTSVLLDRFLA